jgi:hypothetical protein
MRRSQIGLAVLIAAIFQGGIAHQADAASRDDEAINARLQRFAVDPASVFDEELERWSESGAPLRPYPRFSPEAIDNGQAIEARDSHRARMCMEIQGKMRCLGTPQGGGPAALEVIRGNDRPEDLVDGGIIQAPTLEAMEQLGLRASRVPIQPWSDDYWPYFKGILGARYADPAALGPNYRKNRKYARAHPARKIIASGNEKAIDALSPSEKYELVIGDSEGALTSRMWAAGEEFSNSSGVVEDWLGICHGWAPASLAMPRPAKAVVVKSADGKRDIKFYPADIKALASLLWANGDFASKFIGGRCNKKKPKVDSHGRIVDEECFNTNPAAWHLAIANQIGVAKRSFVIDATFDYEVWNQPVVGYSYRYFNPQSSALTNTLAEARVSKAQYTKDHFKKYRSPQAASFVGIVMDMTYVIETDPTHAAFDAPGNDAVVTVRYFYDLELDAAGKIIGGEWQTNKHPDFLWVPQPGAHAHSVAEGDALGEWNGQGVIPDSWRKAAIKAQMESQPLGKIVEMIFRLAQ